MSKIKNIKKVNDLIFEKYKYTPRDFGFNVDSFIEIFLNDYKLEDMRLYHNYDAYIYTDFKNNDNFNIDFSVNRITIKYFNCKGVYHRFNDWAYNTIYFKKYKHPICLFKQYYLHGKLHNLNGPASITYDEYDEKFVYNYYINGKRYYLDSYCEFISKRKLL